MYLSLATSLALAVVFGTSVTTKTRAGAFRAFVDSAGPLTLVPRKWRRRVAIPVIVVEATLFVVLSTWFVLGGIRLLALTTFLSAVVLLAAFTGALTLSLRRGDRMPCRCFGATSAPLGAAHVVRNAVLLLVAATGAAAAVTEPAGGRPAGLGVAAAAGLVTGVLAVLADDIIDLFRTPAADKERTWGY